MKAVFRNLSFGIIILITAFILNLALVLAFQIDQAYDKRSEELNTADLYFCIPEFQNADTLKEECLNLEGVEEIENREGIYTAAVMKDFRGVDFTINTIFYNSDEIHRFNHYELREEIRTDGKSDEELVSLIYVPLFVVEFGEFQVRDTIVYEVEGESYTKPYSGGTPTFVEDNIFEIVIPMDNVAKLQIGPEKTNKETNKEIYSRIIDILEIRPETVVSEIAEILGLSVGGVRYHINKMKKAGIIEHIGSTKKGKWVVHK